jgi:ligand-binding sensor domain-containing protein
LRIKLSKSHLTTGSVVDITVDYIAMKDIISWLLIFVVSASCAQNQTSIQEQNNRNHRTGLSESQLKEAATSEVPISMTRAIEQAENGDILIASYLGVYRYNGAHFINMTSQIDWPTFWDVLEDTNGNLWLASQDSGVYFQSPGQTSFKRFEAEDGTSISSALHIYEDKAGSIWFGTSRYDGDTFKTFTTKDGFPSDDIRLLLEDTTGKLWFGGNGESMFVYDTNLSGEAGQGLTFTAVKNNNGEPFNNVWSIIEDRKGNIWFGADGLWRYDGTNFTKVSNRGAYAIIEDKEGNIWTTGGVTGQKWALSRYDAENLFDESPTVTEIMSQRPALLGLLEATDGSIWFGSMIGAHRYDGKSVTYFKSKEVQN